MSTSARGSLTLDLPYAVTVELMLCSAHIETELGSKIFKEAECQFWEYDTCVCPWQTDKWACQYASKPAILTAMLRHIFRDAQLR